MIHIEVPQDARNKNLQNLSTVQMKEQDVTHDSLMATLVHHKTHGDADPMELRKK